MPRARAPGFRRPKSSFQLGCFALRLSSATPVAASVVGALGVGFSSALAGQASLRTRARSARAPGDPPPRYWRRQDVLLDAALGIAMFKAMGGRYRSLLPSDISRVGSCAVESIPAPGSAYAQGTSKGELVRLMRRREGKGRIEEGWEVGEVEGLGTTTTATHQNVPSRDGCHHCGTRRGRVVGDHMPPNKVAGTSGPPKAAPLFATTPIGAPVPRPRGRPPRPPPPDAAADSALAAARAVWQAGQAAARGAGFNVGRRRAPLATYVKPVWCWVGGACGGRGGAGPNPPVLCNSTPPLPTPPS